jgi:hypothetical protein
MVRYKKMLIREEAIKQGRREQRILNVFMIENWAKKFNIDPTAVNKLILKIKNGEA